MNKKKKWADEMTELGENNIGEKSSMFKETVKLLKGYKELPHGINEDELKKAIYILSYGAGVMISREKKGTGKTKVIWFEDI